MRFKVVFTSVILVVVVSIGFYLISPLFVNNIVDEPFPVDSISATLNNYSEFMKLNETQRMKTVQEMNDTQIDKMMFEAAKINHTINENTSSIGINNSQSSFILSDIFMGVDDGLHDANGIAKVISTNSGNIIRFEDFRTTNGPDLFVYLSSDTTDEEIVDLGRLKRNIGNQNYLIPDETDIKKYNTVLIWCKPFSVLFGSAKVS